MPRDQGKHDLDYAEIDEKDEISGDEQLCPDLVQHPSEI